MSRPWRNISDVTDASNRTGIKRYWFLCDPGVTQAQIEAPEFINRYELRGWHAGDLIAMITDTRHLLYTIVGDDNPTRYVEITQVPALYGGDDQIAAEVPIVTPATGPAAASTEVQAAIDALNAAAVSAAALSGMPLGAVNLGAFPGGTIPDNLSVQGALAALEAAIEAGSAETPFAASNTDTLIDVTAGGTFGHQPVLNLNVGNLVTALMSNAAFVAGINAIITLRFTPPVLSTSAAIPDGQVGVAFSYTPTNSGGLSTNWTATGLPPGVTINATTGVLSGTPTAAGNYAIAITATNAFGNDTFTDTLTMAAAPVAPNLSSSPAMPDGTVGTAFSYTPANTGGPVTTYTATGLPPGVTINAATGVLSGLPTTAGTYTPVITATGPGGTSTFSDTLVMAPALAAPNLSTSAAIPAGTTGSAYSYTPTNTGGAAASWSATGLPTGVSINTTTGVLSGTPTAAGTFNVAITATNAAGSDTHTGSVTIAAALAAPNITTSPAMPDVTTGTAFSWTPTNTGGAAASYSATGLPPGVTINATTGALSGTPTTAGTYTPVITATNAAGSGTFTDTVVISLAVVAPDISTSPAFPAATQGVAFSWTPTNTGGTPTSYTLQSGALPAGLTLNPTTGVISGTPTVSGSFAVTVRATNAGGTGDKAGTIAVAAAPTIAFTGIPGSLDQETTDPDITPAQITFLPNGTITTVANDIPNSGANPDPTGSWASPSTAGLGSLYQIAGTILSQTGAANATTSSGFPLDGSWNTLSGNQSVSRQRSTGTGPATLQVRFDIRDVATSTVRASLTVTLRHVVQL